MTSWWFQPTHFEKYANVKLDHLFPQGSGVKIKQMPEKMKHHMVVF